MSEISRARPLVVSAFLDATAPDIRPFVVDRVRTLEQTGQELKDGFQATAEVYNQRQSLTDKCRTLAKETAGGFRRLGKKGVMALAGVGLLGAVGGAGLAALGLAGVAAWTLSKMPSVRLGMLQPQWTGRRSYQIGQQAELKGEHPTDRRIDSQRVKDSIVANHQRYPSARQVVLAYGHGMGHGALASAPFPTFAEGMKQARAQTGAPVDAVILESCLQGNLESLAALGDSARLAVACEEDLGIQTAAGSMPLQKMLQRLAQDEHPAPGMLQELSQVPRRERPDQLSFVDLEKLQTRLVPSLDQLGSCLAAEFAAGNGDFVNLATVCAPWLKSQENTPVLVDLGEFLSILEKDAPLAESTREAIARTRQALTETVPLQHQEYPSLRLSGLSFAPSLLTGKNTRGEAMPFNNPELPPGWQKFLLAHTRYMQRQK